MKWCFYHIVEQISNIHKRPVNVSECFSVSGWIQYGHINWHWYSNDIIW